jgi:hypothetical protein
MEKRYVAAIDTSTRHVDKIENIGHNNSRKGTKGSKKEKGVSS